MAYQVRLARTAMTILAALALAIFTAGVAMVVAPVAAFASTQVAIGNGDVAALQAALSAAPAGATETINLATGGTYTLTSVDNVPYGPTGLPLIATGAVVIIQGHGSTIERSSAAGTPDFNILTVPPAATLTLDNATISNGTVTGSGGGLEAQGNLTLNNAKVQGNAAGGNGGGINDDDCGGGTVTVSHSVISGNTAAGNGGGINENGCGGVLTVNNSTLSGNTATGDGGGISNFNNITDSSVSGNTAFDGGGIYDSGLISDDGAIYDSTINANTSSDAAGGVYLVAASLLSSTVSGNTTKGAGGGVFANAPAEGIDPQLLHDTITLNAGADGSGLSVEDSWLDSEDSGVVSVGDCIISGNDGGTNVGSLDDQPSFPGPYIYSYGYNITGYSTTAGQYNPAISWFNGPGEQNGKQESTPPAVSLGVNAYLGPLLDNGGPTRTQLPGYASPAIDAGIQALTGDPYGNFPAPATDQRGLPRVVSLPGYPNVADGTDIGAVELQTAPVEALVVTITGDPSDPGQGTSLREALTNALAGGGGTITFAIPGSGPHTITLKSALPQITSDITLDNTSGSAITIKEPAGGSVLFATDGGQLSLSGLTLKGNSAGDTGIEADDSLDITDSTITGFGNAGIVFDASSLTMSDSKVTDNGNGISEVTNGASITITGSTFTGNKSSGEGGAFTLWGQANTISISGSTFDGNSAALYGGAIGANPESDLADNTLTVTNCTMTHNSAGLGGAIETGGTTLNITNSTLNSNSAAQGGAISFGGGGALTLDASTLNGNAASGSGENTGGGGGIVATGGDVTITNSTLSGNKTAGDGGAIYNTGSLLSVASSTIAGNTAPAGDGGGIATVSGAQTNVTNSIIDLDSGDDVDVEQGSITGVVVSGGYNLIGTGNAVGLFTQPGDQTGVTKPKLGALAANGGPTKTRALLPQSPAINAGDNADCPATDQRGLPRPQGSGCDIGSFQVQAG
jgi:hypothetical protein